MKKNRKKRKSFSIWEHFICSKIHREIINGEETDRAAVFAAGLWIHNWSTHREKNTERQYDFISPTGNEIWVKDGEREG